MVFRSVCTIFARSKCCNNLLNALNMNFFKTIIISCCVATSLMACANGNSETQAATEADTTISQVNTSQVIDGKVNEINQDQFAELIADWQTGEWNFKGPRPAIVDFNATWCGPCRKLAPILKELAKEYASKIDFYSVDVDQNMPMAQAFGIRSIPMLLICPVDGQPQGLTGLHPKDDIKTAITDITGIE